MKIKWNSSKLGYKPNQIYSTGLEYCFISEMNEQCHGFVLCKDFLQDAVCGFLNKKVASIYGFFYDPATMPPIMLSKTRLAMANMQDKKFITKINAVTDFIHQIEKVLKLKRSRFTVCANPPKIYDSGVIVIQGSSRWQEAPPMISLYTLLLRIGFVHKIGSSCEDTFKSLMSGKTEPYQSHDTSYLTTSKAYIDKILKNGYRSIFYSDIMRNYPSTVDIHTMHDSFGIVGFSQQYPKSYVPGWFRSKKRKPKEASQDIAKTA